MSARGHSAGTGSKDQTARGDAGRVFVDHDAALAFLNSRANFERSRTRVKDAPETFKLERMHALLKELGDPHLQIPCVHVAGSKGKGSTCAMLEGCLRACGYATGLFTSPHVNDERERVMISGEMVGESVFDDALGLCKDAAETISTKRGKGSEAYGDATYFELVTAVAFVVFAQSAVDIAVIETGLGGRLDCTNVVKPLVVGLTSIQLEHTDVLGSTLEAIAGEKAGIMKAGVPAVSVGQNDDVLGVFESRAAEIGCDLKVLGRDIVYTDRFQATTTRAAHRRVCVGDGEGALEHISVPLLGEHQAVNCGLALAMALELRSQGFDLSENSVIAGLRGVSRRGCLERVHEAPRVYVDGAHTKASVRETVRAAREQLRFDSVVVVFGCASDKDIDGMLKELMSVADKVVFTRAKDHQRGVDADELRERFKALGGGMCEAHADVGEAVRAAARAVMGGDLVLALGSFVLAGEVKRFVEETTRAPAGS